MQSETGMKSFDCVKWTRETRDRISAEIRDMSDEELSRWLEARRPQDPFLAALFDLRTSPRGSRAPARTPPGISAWWSDSDVALGRNQRMTRKTSRTSWTFSGFGQTCGRRWSVTVMNPWSKGECTVCTGIPKD